MTVKIEWFFKKNPVSPYFVNVPDALKAVDLIEKDTKRFPDTHGWRMAEFAYDATRPTRLSPLTFLQVAPRAVTRTATIGRGTRLHLHGAPEAVNRLTV